MSKFILAFMFISFIGVSLAHADTRQAAVKLPPPAKRISSTPKEVVKKVSTPDEVCRHDEYMAQDLGTWVVCAKMFPAKRIASKR